MARVELVGVSKSYGHATNNLAVDDVSLIVEDREFLVLVGPSGCGKTTTLRMIAGLEHGSAGEIHVGDRRVDGVAPRDRNIAMVFQNYALYPHMTVYKNMAFGLELRYGGGWMARLARRLFQPAKATELENRRREIPDRVRRTAATLGIEHLLNRKPHQLSGGERQRVALGRAIVREPAAFLFDEPLSNLDARLRTEMRVELKRLHRRLGATMIYVTHDQVEALTLGDRVAVMKGGQILQIGTPMEVYDQPRHRFVASFLGSPGMNLLTARVRTGDMMAVEGDNWVYLLGEDCLSPDLTKQLTARANQEITVGVRPEDVHVATSQTPRHDTLECQVVAVDRLGDSAMLYLDLGKLDRRQEDLPMTDGDDRWAPSSHVSADSSRLVMKASGRTADVTGKSIGVYLDRERLHFFDHQTGMNLAKAGES